METLSHKDILALNHAIGEIYAARDLEAFYSSVFSSVLNMISCEYCNFNDINPITTSFLQVSSSSQTHATVTKKLLSVFNAYVHEHPLISHFASQQVVKTTDFVSKRRFKATALYNEYFRHLDTETQIGFSMPVSPGKAILLGLSRNNRDFSERDRLLLSLLNPHLMGALRHVKELGQVRLERDLLHRGAEAQNQGVVLCRQDGMVIALSETAREMFAKYCAVTLAEGDALPEALARWIEVRVGKQAGCARQVEREAFSIEKDGKRLIIKLLNDVTSADYLLCMTENDPEILFHNLQRYALSPRETDVVRWLAKGKTNIEIAVILNISKRTTDKHLEHIFTKLGVETRAAAVALTRNECM